MTKHSAKTVNIELPDGFLPTLIRSVRSYSTKLLNELEKLEEESRVIASPDFFDAKEEINDIKDDLDNIAEIMKELDSVNGLDIKEFKSPGRPVVHPLLKKTDD